MNSVPQAKSEEHSHEPPKRMSYSVALVGAHWWQPTRTLTLTGIGSSVQAGELLIFGDNGALTCINFSRVLWMTATPLEQGKERLLSHTP